MMQQKQCRGGIFFSRISYVKEKYGMNGLQKLLSEMKKMGYNGPLDEKEIKIMKAYPMDYNIIFLKAYKNVFGEKSFKNMSREAAKRKGIVGTFLKWAGSPEMIIGRAGDYWSKFYLFGKLEGEMVGEKKAVVKGYDVSPDPIFCEHLTEYYKGVFENINIKDLNVEHVKCIHEGDDHCEWVLTWGDMKNDRNLKYTKTIKWDVSLESGVDEIDRQHMYFVDILNEINRSVLKNYRYSALRAIKFMDHYAHWHFSSEEKYMKKYGYPDYETHVKEHEKFYKYTKDMMRKIEDYGINSDIAYSIQKYLIDWLINHIKYTDRKFAEFLRSKNLRMEEEEIPREIAEKLEN